MSLVLLVLASGPCFTTHLDEAIALNEKRMPLYSKLTGGKSEALSKKLIQSEKLSKLFAGPIEKKAKAFQEADIPLLCRDFVEMKHVPDFKEKGDKPSAEPLKTDTAPLSKAWKEKGFEGLHEAAEKFIKEIAKPAEHHCMIRHVVESAARIAWLAPKYDERAKEKGLKEKPSDVSKSLVDLHLMSLKLAAELDEMAVPLQKDGVPILCQDVPPIDSRPSLDENVTF